MSSRPDAPDEVPEGPRLPDRWAPGGSILLNGPLEQRSMRGGTFDVVMGIVGLGVAFLLFQVLITPVLLLLQIGIGGEGLSPEVMGDPARLMATYTRELIVSNGVGQLLGLALPALLLTRLHTSRIDGYLRLRGASVQLLVLAVVGVVGLQPVVQWLAQVNQQLPLPESMQAFEQTQMELIRSVLESGLGLPFNLLMLSLIPGLCEELLFRGYAQRQFERGAGPVGGILLSGVLFGVYHLRLSQVLPLVLLGCYLAYLTWRTGSLWPAVLVHMAHNALAVGAARAARTHPAYDLQELEQVAIPWYALLGGLVIVGAVLYVLHPLARRIRDG